MQNALTEWAKVAEHIEAAIANLDDADLDRRGGSDGWSVRETVHHLVEANLIASNMILAALANDGYEFDWTWVNPDKAWMRRVGYDRADPHPAIELLRALTRHISELLAHRPGVLARSVSVNDAPRKPRYTRTIETMLTEEAQHVREHLKDVEKIRHEHVRR